MTYKLKLNQVREVLGMEIKLEIVKLMDGTTVEVEKFEPGFPAYIVSEDGSKVLAPAGEHTLEDGTTIELDENGLIVEIEAAEAEDVAEETTVEVSGAKTKKMEEMPEAAKVDVAMVEEAIIAKVEEKVAEKMKAIFEAVEEVAKEVASVKEEMGAMKSKMEKFSKAPAANPIPKVTMPNVVDAIDAIGAKAEFLKSIAKK
jgi:uncharacterized protein YuzE